MTDEIKLEPMADGLARKMFPDLTTEEVVAEIVAADPQKHGVTLAERMRRAVAQATAEAAADAKEQPGQQTEPLPVSVPAPAGAAPTLCDHDFGEDPQESTPCAKCGVTFGQWAVS